MLVTKISGLTGKEHTLDIPVTREQLIAVKNRRANGVLIQNIVPHLSMEQREFLMSGITP